MKLLRTHQVTTFAALVLGFFAACSPFSPELSQSPFGNCANNGGKCPEGYSCKIVNAQTSVCEKGDGSGPDAALPSSDAVGDLICNNDSALEGSTGNETITSANVIPPRTLGTSFKFTQVAICPASDKDTYKITVDANATNISVVVDFDRGAPLAVTILNSDGMSVLSGTTTGRQIRANLANAAAGEYYVQVTGTGNNNYDIAITQSR